MPLRRCHGYRRLSGNAFLSRKAPKFLLSARCQQAKKKPTFYFVHVYYFMNLKCSAAAIAVAVTVAVLGSNVLNITPLNTAHTLRDSSSFFRLFLSSFLRFTVSLRPCHRHCLIFRCFFRQKYEIMSKWHFLGE